MGTGRVENAIVVAIGGGSRARGVQDEGAARAADVVGNRAEIDVAGGAVIWEDLCDDERSIVSVGPAVMVALRGAKRARMSCVVEGGIGWRPDALTAMDVRGPRRCSSSGASASVVVVTKLSEELDEESEEHEDVVPTESEESMDACDRGRSRAVVWPNSQRPVCSCTASWRWPVSVAVETRGAGGTWGGAVVRTVGAVARTVGAGAAA
jgi:hypothetical protein